MKTARLRRMDENRARRKKSFHQDKQNREAHLIACSCIIRAVEYSYPSCKLLCKKFGAGTDIRVVPKH